MKLMKACAQECQWKRALLYGESGSGKTTSLKTLPVAQTVIASAERGLVPLAGTEFDVIRLDTWDDVREMVAELQKTRTINGQEKRVLAVDSLSELSDLCKRQIIDVDRRVVLADRGQERIKKSYDDLMQMEDWNLYQTRMGNMISALVQLQMHVICTALAAHKEDKSTGIVRVVTDLNGALALKTPKWFDLVLYMRSVKQDGKDVRVWQTTNDGIITAKDASGLLAEYEEPNWSSVFGKLSVAKQVQNGGK